MQIATDSKPIPDEIRTRMERYRRELLDFGMQEPSRRESSVWYWFFFKPTTELTAFIVNLTGYNDYIEVVCGYASTAFTRFAGCENALIESGVPNEDITIREKFLLCTEEDEETVTPLIAELYSKYAQTEKDDLLNYAKQKRKAFIQQISVKLKPLGFRKKANTWSRTLEGEYYLMFNAQKSGFSDEYYFNVYIGKTGTNRYGDCYYTRLAPQGMCPMDWQALNSAEFDFFLTRTVIPALEKIIRTPLPDLGKSEHIWSCCSCDRRQCKHCWVEKNLWEAKAIM